MNEHILPCVQRVTGTDIRLVKDENGQTKGAKVQDTISKETWEIEAKAVVNATGCFCDAIRCGNGSPACCNRNTCGQGVFRHGTGIVQGGSSTVLPPGI